jgi:anaerobic ribonucleoside-triphosphate reductase activating protein
MRPRTRAPAELTWLLDPATGLLVLEGLAAPEAARLAGDLLPPGQALVCARPHAVAPLPVPTSAAGPVLRVARLYHGSLIEGPGRRSVVQTQGCPLRCARCVVPETHDPAGGVALPVPDVLAAVLDPGGLPRDGVTILGGEPFFQPAGLAALLRALKQRDIHTVVYSGYTLEALARRPEPEVREALELADVLIDGPYVAALAEGAGPWTGSANQRVIDLPATRRCGRVVRRKATMSPDLVGSDVTHEPGRAIHAANEIGMREHQE